MAGLTSCSTSSDIRAQTEKDIHIDMNVVTMSIGGFIIDMTPGAVMNVMHEKGYAESSSNTETLEEMILHPDLYPNSTIYINETIPFDPNNPFQRQGEFILDFSRGRVVGIACNLDLSEKELDAIYAKNEESLKFITDRKKIVSSDDESINEDWRYTGGKYSHIWITYHWQKRGTLNFSSYSITVHDFDYDMERVLSENY
jgi:hypothetical protein